MQKIAIPPAKDVPPGTMVLALSGTEKKDYIFGAVILLLAAASVGYFVGKTKR